MRWPHQFTKRQIISSSIWLFVGLALVASLALAVHNDSVAYEARNPEHSKVGWHPKPSGFAIGFQLFEIFGAGAAVGASIGALTRHQFAWTLGGIALPIAARVVWLLFFR